MMRTISNRTGRLLSHGGSALALAISTLYASPAVAQDTAQSAEAASADDDEVIIVTAQKRKQTLPEIPQAISVVGGQTLERQQATSFSDYAALVPGLSIDEDNPGESRVILRGINTGSVASTVAVYVDETVFGSSAGLSNGGVLAGDFDTFDVARVEVLKGPQGTLYGSNALGGVIKFVTAPPLLGALEVRGQAGVEATEGGGTGWLGNAVVNVPLGDKAAIRATGFYRKRAGFIDTIGPNTSENANDSSSYGGRVQLLFEPTDNFSIRLMALAQNIRADQSSNYDADPVTFEPVNAITGLASDRFTQYSTIPAQNDVDYRLYNGTLSWDFGFANLTSVTSYSILDQRQLVDASTVDDRNDSNFLYLCCGAATGESGLALDADIKTKKFTQEVRIASPDSDVFEWLVGGYYTHEKSTLFQNFLAFDLATGAFFSRALDLTPLGVPFQTDEFVVVTLDSTYEEIAGFGSVTWHISPDFDITAGARYSHNKQRAEQFTNVLGGAPGLGVLQTINGASSENVFTWSIAPRFDVSEDVAIYARVAKGYRPGGPNAVPPTAGPDFPFSYVADTIVSYEAGIRGQTPDRVFSFDASVYYLDWKDIQLFTVIQTPFGNFGVNANGRGARSYGAELTGRVRPIRGLNLVGNFSYVNAKLTDDTTLMDGGINIPGGLDGDRLPNTPEFSANLSADYEWALSDRAQAFVGGNIRWTSDQFTSGFSPDYRAAPIDGGFGRRLEIDDYVTVDLRAGVDFGAVTVQIFAKNVTNAEGFNNIGGFPQVVPATLEPTSTEAGLVSASPIRPRTFGATVGFEF